MIVESIKQCLLDPGGAFELLHNAGGPGFEAVFAIAGILPFVVAYLVLRKKK